MSLMFAVNWASCACKCDSCRAFEADVGTVDKREVLCVRVAPGVRGLSDISWLTSAGRYAAVFLNI